jgi:hypothetical protein
VILEEIKKERQWIFSDCYIEIKTSIVIILMTQNAPK